MNNNINAVIEFILSVSTLLLCFKIYIFNKRNLSLNIFLLLLVFFSLWVFNLGIINTIIVESNRLFGINFLIKLSYYIGTITSSLLIIFSYNYPNRNKIDFKFISFFIFIEIIFFYLILFTNYVISDSLVLDSGIIKWEFGYIWYIFETYYILSFIYSVLILIKKYRDYKFDANVRSSILYILISLSITILSLLTTNILLPRINIFNYEWIGLLVSPISIYIIIYTIIKYDFLKVRIYLLEVFTILLISFNIVSVVFNGNLLSIYLYKIISFISVVILGLLLVNSLRNEKKQRNFIERMSNRVIEE